MTENQTLTEIIQESLAVEDPTVDTLEAPEDAGEVAEADDELDIESLLAEDDDEDAEDDADSDDEGDEDPRLDETFQVKVDGEVVEVTLKEALAGYQRQADYTRKAQALAAEREELEQAIGEFSDTLGTLEQLDQAWDENPVTVLKHFLANTENPTYAFALLLKESAGAGLLEKEFLEMFGITDDVQADWAKESEVDTLRRKVSATESEKAKKQQELEYEAEVERAIAEYDRQIDEILDAEGLDLSPKQRDAFRSKLAGYAAENELTNLRAAYKALKYEETQKKRQLADKAAKRAKQKKNASVVGRSGAGSSGSAPVTDSTDLTAVIKAAMAEQGLA